MSYFNLYLTNNIVMEQKSTTGNIQTRCLLQVCREQATWAGE